MKRCNQPFVFPSGLKIKNRMLLAPLTTSNGTSEGGLTEEDCEFILRRSHGLGAVIIGSHSISSGGSAFSGGWNIYKPENHPMLIRLVEKLHKQNVKVFIQIYHAGRLAQPAFNSGKQSIAPSRVPPLRGIASFPREMESSEIEETINEFQEATKIAIRLGFDGVELHGANTYLIQQFYSPHSNRRNDEWGGNREKRLKFPLEVIKACREVIDQSNAGSFILGYRFSPEEYETPGIRLEDTCHLLENIALPSLLDYVHISISDFRKKSLDGQPILKEVQSVVPKDIPLIGCGNIHTLKDVNEVLKEVSLFSIANAPIIDPLWARKVTNRNAEIKKLLTVRDRERLRIPPGLWKMLINEPLGYFHPVSNEDLSGEKLSKPLPLRQ